MKISEIVGETDDIELTAKVKVKSAIRNFSSGNGQFQNLELFDGISIKLTAFNDDVKKFEHVKEGMVYTFLNVRAKKANENYLKLCPNVNRMELLTSKDFEVLVSDDAFGNGDEGDGECVSVADMFWDQGFAGKQKQF